MNGMEMLEKMEMISDEFIQEADKPYLSAGKNSRGKVIWLYYAGVAAGFVLMFFSVAMIVLGMNSVQTAPSQSDQWIGSIFSDNGSLGIFLLLVSIALIVLFIILLRRKKRDR